MSGAIFFQPLVGLLRGPLAGHVAIHDEGVEVLGEQTRFHVLLGAGGHDRGAGAGEHVALKFQHGFFFFDQQHAAVDSAFMQARRGLGHFGLDVGRGGGGQAHFDGCAAVGSVVGGDVAAMFLHDAVADAQAEAGAFADALRGVERIEDALGIFDSGAVVGELGANVAAGRHDANLQLAGASGFKNGIDGIVDDVQEDLLDLMRIGDDHARARRASRARH